MPEGDLFAALRLRVVNRERVELVAVVAAEGFEVADEGFRAGAGVFVPLRAGQRILRVVVDRLHVGCAGFDDGGDDGAGERGAGGGDEF